MKTGANPPRNAKQEECAVVPMDSPVIIAVKLKVIYLSIYSKMGMPTIDTSCVVVPPTAHWERAKYKMHPGKVCVIVCCNAIMIIISNHRGFHRILRVM